MQPNPTQRFSDRAADYVSGRPSYPVASLNILYRGLGNPASLTVVDLGAGTGISSRLLAAREATVIAIEPNAAMRDHAAPCAHVIWKDGTAENTGLETGSIDLVTAFQAFHWFNYVDALREMTRIARPGGRAAILYNERDESDQFTAEYGELVRRFATDKTENSRGRAAFKAYAGWSGVRVVEFKNLQLLDRDGFHARARSTSYLPKAGADAATLHAAIDALFDEHATDGEVTMLMKTIVTVGDVAA